MAWRRINSFIKPSLHTITQSASLLFISSLSHRLNTKRLYTYKRSYKPASFHKKRALLVSQPLQANESQPPSPIRFINRKGNIVNRNLEINSFLSFLPRRRPKQILLVNKVSKLWQVLPFRWPVKRMNNKVPAYADGKYPPAFGFPPRVRYW